MLTRKSAKRIIAFGGRLSWPKVTRVKGRMIKAKARRAKTSGVSLSHQSKAASSSNRAALAADEAEAKVKMTKEGKERTRAKERKEVQAKAKAKISGTTAVADHGETKVEEMVLGIGLPARTIGHSHRTVVSLTHHVEADTLISQTLPLPQHTTG